MDDKPQFKHDCNDYKFLGRHSLNDIGYDLYFCPQGRIPTVIARYGDEGYEYHSGLGLPMPELEEAARRAVAQGYLEAQEEKAVVDETEGSWFDYDGEFEERFKQSMDAAEARS